MYDVTNRHEQFYSRDIHKIVKISRSVKIYHWTETRYPDYPMLMFRPAHMVRKPKLDGAARLPIEFNLIFLIRSVSADIDDASTVHSV